MSPQVVETPDSMPKRGASGQRLVEWSAEEGAAFATRPMLSRHGLHRLDLFTDAGLVALLEGYPRDRLQAFTMGTDVTKPKEWKPVDTRNISGADLLSAVKRGRLWMNILQVHVVDPRFSAVVDQLYDELSGCCPGFRPHRKSATLLISSPTALVYYHVDAQPNLLWHIRGTKRTWIYPAGDRELINQTLMEDVFASFADEEAPFRPAFDQKAAAFDVTPGDVVSWPQNSPHRVTNVEGLNVSLSTVHETEESDRRKTLFCANRFFNRTCGLPTRSTKETGTVASLKRLAYRGCWRAGLVKTPPRRAYITDLNIDPSATGAVTSVSDGPRLTEFSEKDFLLQRDSVGKVSPVERRR